MKICLPHVQSDLEEDVHTLCNEFFLDLVAQNHFLGISGSSLVTVGTCQLPLADSCSYVLHLACIRKLETSVFCQIIVFAFNIERRAIKIHTSGGREPPDPQNWTKSAQFIQYTGYGLHLDAEQEQLYSHRIIC